MHPKGQPKKDRQDLVIILGANQLDNPFEVGRVSARVHEIKIQKDYNSEDYHRFTGDLAMLTLTENVTFTAFVRPICLLQEGQKTGREGIIAGWGSTINGKGHAETLTAIKVPIVDSEDCYRFDFRMARIGWPESFCAGESERGVCAGDSGSGLYVKIANRFYLKGLVSSAINGGGCNGNYLTIFTDVPRYDLDVLAPTSEVKRLDDGDSETSEGCGKLQSVKFLSNDFLTTSAVKEDEFPWLLLLTHESYSDTTGLFLSNETFLIYNTRDSDKSLNGTFSVDLNDGSDFKSGIEIYKNLSLPKEFSRYNPGLLQLSEQIENFDNFPCIFSSAHIPEIEQQVFAIGETLSRGREVAVGKIIPRNFCSRVMDKKVEKDEFCVNLVVSFAPNFAFIVDKKRLFLVGMMEYFQYENNKINTDGWDNPENMIVRYKAITEQNIIFS